jgi:hypothetical protein
MLKFKFESSTEDIVITVNAAKSITLNGQVIPIGAHLVSFSGRAFLSSDDLNTVENMADNNDDEVMIANEGEIVGGPLWEKVTQCSPILAGSNYYNTDSDSDDWQGWQLINGAWDTVEDKGKKKIRLNFIIGQHGQKTRFYAVNYKVTATGDLAFASEAPPTPPMPPTPSECDKQRSITDASSSGDHSAPFNAQNVKDNDLNTRWMSPSSGTQIPWIMVGLTGDAAPICRVDIAWVGGNAYKFNVDVSADNVTWTNVLSNKQSGMTSSFETYTFAATQAKFLKITITESTPDASTVLAQISEIRVFGNT